MLRYILLVSGLIGSAYCFYTDEHLALTLVTDRAKGPFKTVLNVFIEACIIFFVIYVFIYGGWKLAATAINVSSVMRIPMKLLYMVEPLCGVLIILANMFFGAVSGSSVAATSAMGSILSPLEKDEGYDPNYSAAVNICSAPTGILIPPSGPLILYSITAGGVSITALFMGGYFTGILLGLCVGAVAMYLAVKLGYKQSTVVDEDPAWKILVDAIPSLLAVVIVMGGILGGIFTATEAGVVMCVYCLVLALIYRELDFKTFYNLLADTMKSSATILFLIAASSIMAYVMARTGIPKAISDAIMGISDNRYVILLVMNIFLLVMGMFLDLTPAVLIFTPIFLPIATSIGMSPVHFGLMLILNMGIGSVTPPVGSCLFVGCGIANVKIEGVTKYIVPIFASMVVALFLITFIPQIPLSVPYWSGLIDSMGWMF